RVHHPPRRRAARHADQGELGASRLGQDAARRPGRADGDRRQREDQRTARDAGRRWPVRRFLPRRRPAALVARNPGPRIVYRRQLLLAKMQQETSAMRLSFRSVAILIALSFFALALTLTVAP